MPRVNTTQAGAWQMQPPYHVSEEALKKTDKCPNSFSCLNSMPPSPCQVGRALSDSFLFVKTKGAAACPYCIDFGFSSHVCSCPVRNEIFRSYGV